MTTRREAFTLVLRPLTPWPTQTAPVPVIVRLRTALKRLLRSHGLQCVRCCVGEPGPEPNLFLASHRKATAARRRHAEPALVSPDSLSAELSKRSGFPDGVASTVAAGATEKIEQKA
jgi:hypothetical protein